MDYFLQGNRGRHTLRVWIATFSLRLVGMVLPVTRGTKCCQIRRVCSSSHVGEVMVTSLRKKGSNSIGMTEPEKIAHLRSRQGRREQQAVPLGDQNIRGS